MVDLMGTQTIFSQLLA